MLREFSCHQSDKLRNYNHRKFVYSNYDQVFNNMCTGNYATAV